MRERLVQYVELLFAGAADAGEIKQEILQNTLDRYDDLISQGKTPEAAYRLAISGIGDINEILGSGAEPAEESFPASAAVDYRGRPVPPVWKTILRAIGVCLYILCPVPLFILQNETGLCGLLTFVAVATALMIISGSKNDYADRQPSESGAPSPRSELRKALNAIIWAAGLCIYFIMSFVTGAWYITWVLFLIIPAVQGLVRACMDLREASKYED